MAVRRYFHPLRRRDTLHLRGAFLLDDRTLDKSDYPLQDRHFRLSTPRYTHIPRKIRVSVHEYAVDVAPVAASRNITARSRAASTTSVCRLSLKT